MQFARAPLLAALLGAVCAHAYALRHERGASDSASCSVRDTAFRALLQSRLGDLEPTCEAMCKTVGAYPNCHCPGFNGQAASTEDVRSCAGKYCKPGADSCPTDAFVLCVKEKTKVSALLQWGDLLSRVNQSSMSLANGERRIEELREAHDVARRVLLQARVNALQPTCEAMCKKVGAYPHCNCPGFNGQAASTEDVRSCAGKYCKSGADSCPTDAFVLCVKEKTKVSALLQWDDLMARLDQGTSTVMKLASQ
eukprot:CAMPEP_0117553894 /NCGR_PEP_ID=MMETSP0784-20121206/50466_1 /TAXON_ID=39447 /ORGANISM="" /LENGTH=252 /DNA_ID=CAMNT_0005351027 /DNA_START=1 /DNA_END=759 /DNA_ORIENTATION=-